MTQRIAHVKRIHRMVIDPNFPDNPPEMSSSEWIDVLRIDKLPVHFQADTDPPGVEGQVIYYVLNWNDDINNPDPNTDASQADEQFENANPSRKTKKLKIKNPSANATDPDAPLDDDNLYLWIVEGIRLSDPRGKDFPVGQFINYKFNNLPLDGSEGTPSTTRKTTPVKVVHNDLGGLQMMDENNKPLIIDWDIYYQALLNGKTDPKDTFFYTVEVVNRATIRFGPDASTGVISQNKMFTLTGNEKIIENLFEAGDPDIVDADGNSALIRLDPLQVIVNAGSGIIAVEFAPGIT